MYMMYMNVNIPPYPTAEHHQRNMINVTCT